MDSAAAMARKRIGCQPDSVRFLSAMFCIPDREGDQGDDPEDHERVEELVLHAAALLVLSGLSPKWQSSLW